MEDERQRVKKPQIGPEIDKLVSQTTTRIHIPEAEAIAIPGRRL